MHGVQEAPRAAVRAAPDALVMDGISKQHPTVPEHREPALPSGRALVPTHLAAEADVHLRLCMLGQVPVHGSQG
jgi:hypothetical protein